MARRYADCRGRNAFPANAAVLELDRSIVLVESITSLRLLR